VVNFDLPNVAEDYVHRIGRTGRAGKEGVAVSLVCIDEHKLLRNIEQLIKRDIPKLLIENFEPDPTIKAEPIRKPPAQPRHSLGHKPHRSQETGSAAGNSRNRQRRGHKHVA